MKLHFDPNQQFQLDAVNSIVGIFEGQPLNESDFGMWIKSKAVELGLGKQFEYYNINDDYRDDIQVSFTTKTIENNKKKQIKTNENEKK